MNTIYKLATTVFKAESNETQNLQYDILKKEIERFLKNNDDMYITNAILESQQDGKIAVSNAIESLSQELVNTTYRNDHIHTFRSDFFIIPIITRNNSEDIKIPSIHFFEKTLQEQFIAADLIPKKSKVVLAPVLLGYQTSLQMSVSKWYDLHQQVVNNASKRHLRKMFTQDFFIKTRPMYPTLSFLVGSVIQSKDEITNSMPLEPNLFKNNISTQESLNQFSQKFQSIVQSKLSSFSKTEIITIAPNNAINGLIIGYNYQQRLLTESFVNMHANSPDIDFALISLDIPNNFCVLAWDREKNEVINYLLVEPFGTEMQDNVDMIMGYINNINVKTYVGNSLVQSDHIIDNYKTFDFNEYIKNEGVSILEKNNSYEEY